MPLRRDDMVGSPSLGVSSRMVPQVGWVRRTFDELLEKVEHLGRLDRVFPGMRVRMARGWDHVERECTCLHGVRRGLRTHK